MERGTRLDVTLLALLVAATISGVVAFGVGFPDAKRATDLEGRGADTRGDTCVML